MNFTKVMPNSRQGFTRLVDFGDAISSRTKGVSPKLTTGFTLIELLVVVAIVGILASVVLVSLDSARGKGGDAAVKSNLNQVRTKAEMLYDTYGCYVNDAYTTTCSSIRPNVFNTASCPITVALSSPTRDRIFYQLDIMSMIAAAKKASGATYTACGSTVKGTAWAVAVQLFDKTQVLCIDSTGVFKTNTGVANSQAGVNGTIITGACL